MLDVITPDWPAHERVKAFTTCRAGGVSQKGFASLNLASHVGDIESNVTKNRSLLVREGGLPAGPIWLEQIHGTTVIDLGRSDNMAFAQADASLTVKADLVCAVMTADCLPVLLCNKNGTAVAAVHAGWRGLLAGVIEKTVNKIGEAEQLLAWLGPAIGPGRFEVGAEVRQAFVKKKSIMQQAFCEVDSSHYLADLYALARMILLHSGVKKIYGGEHCTYNQPDQFYSYRRDSVTGRMASLIWLQA